MSCTHNITPWESKKTTLSSTKDFVSSRWDMTCQGCLPIDFDHQMGGYTVDGLTLKLK